MPQTAQNFRLTVLNPGGRDPEQQFHGALLPAKAPIPRSIFMLSPRAHSGLFIAKPTTPSPKRYRFSVFAWRLWRGGARTDSIKAGGPPRRDFTKRNGAAPDRAPVARPGEICPLLKIVNRADACLAPTPEAADIYQRTRSKWDPVTVAFIPTPYPIEDQRWDFSVGERDQGFSSAHANGRCFREIISPRSWWRGG